MNTATMTANGPDSTTPWYRQLWPWLLMAAPAAALIGGIFTFYLAATTNNALVVDDYYKEGKAINRQIARDARAAELGLVANVAAGAQGGLTVRLAGRSDLALPDTLTLKIMHATRAELDRETTLPSIGAGSYARPELELPKEGRWNVQVEPADKSWRLVGVASSGFAQPLELKADGR